MESIRRPDVQGTGTVDITRGLRKSVVQQTRTGMRMEVEALLAVFRVNKAQPTVDVREL